MLFVCSQVAVLMLLQTCHVACTPPPSCCHGNSLGEDVNVLSLFPPPSPSLLSLSQERQECLKMAQSQEQELTSLQESLGQCRTELKAANIKNSELKRALDEITLQLKKRVPITHYSLVLRPHPTFRNFQYSDLSFAHVGQT